MSTDALVSPLVSGRGPARAAARMRVFARAEGPVLLTVAVFAAAVALFTPLVQLTQDGWLTLAAGRDVVHHGLGNRDSLAILTHGENWVDQQWLAQAAFYGLARAGGVKLALLVHFVLVVGAFGAALAVARRRGGDVLAVSWIGALLMLIVIWGAAMRSQNFAYPLFVAVFALLIFDRGRLAPRILLALPLLAVWANLHGSVVLGAALVCLYAATSAVGLIRSGAGRGPLLRCALLAAGAVAAVLITPFGSSIVGYYHSILGNPDMHVVKEWRPVTEAGQAWLFFAVLAISAAVVARGHKRLRAFEILALVLMAAAAFEAMRNVVWFGFAALMILPVAVSGRPDRESAKQPLALFAPLAIGVLAIVAAVAVGRGEGWYQQEWSPAAATRVATAVRAEPGARVWASERFADWLLWRQPQLSGHIAYDARLELLRHADFRAISRFNATRGHWQQIVARYEIVVLDSQVNRRQIDGLRSGAGRPVLYRDRFVTVLGSPAAGRSASTSPTA